MVTGSEQESEAPAESGVEDDVMPAPKGHVEFNPAVVVDAPRDTPNVKVSNSLCIENTRIKLLAY